MLKLMHTSDLHLKENRQERTECLKALVKLGVEEDVDILIVTGDFFDSKKDAELLSPFIKDIFKDIPFRALILPGNNDLFLYRGKIELGKQVAIIDGKDNPLEIGNVRFWAVPSEIIDAGKVLPFLKDFNNKKNDKKSDILLFHGEILDDYFSRNDFGDEGIDRYMPLKASYFEGLIFDYVLSGHLHSRFKTWELNNGGYFVYPGSPLPISRRETGERKVNIFFTGEIPEARRLNTPYYEKLDVLLDPFEAGNPLDTVNEKITTLPGNAKVILSVKGYFNGEPQNLNELKLSEEIKKISASRGEGEISFEARDISMVLRNDIFRSFNSLLEKSDLTKEKQSGIRDLTIKAMLEVIS